MLLVHAGFPPPTTQIPVMDGWRLLAVLDMGWEDIKVAIEYDGDHHRTIRAQYVKDRRRLRRLEQLAWIVIQVIAEDRPDDILRRVREAILSRTSPRSTAA
jgi:very-short-patch-repair endonuclease